MHIEETRAVAPAGPAPGRWILEIADADMAPALRPGDFVEVDALDRRPSPPGVFVLAERRGGTERLLVRRLEVCGPMPAYVRITCDGGTAPNRMALLEDLDVRGRVVGAFVLWGKGEVRS
ncbi:hypothetical protein FHP25_13255 [Vineibacter terrae]|uniref:S24 family peptidase n=1 Tax=Vineibacter terrae TaxID=2586908 RepID=A0A5C8PN79_9HYPH|nr:hypothetical protein [Vineibacter terrae]TXL75617.1 hypothetical protein FHP25_13255 [Vineibacter terrae]